MFGKNASKNSDLEFFTIYDSKSKIYSRPMSAMNREDMVRQVTNMMRDPQQAQNPYLINAEDFSLFSCAKFSSQTGQIFSEQLEHIVNFHDLRAIAIPSPGIVST